MTNRYEEQYVVLVEDGGGYDRGYDPLPKPIIVGGPATKAACQQMADDRNYGSGPGSPYARVAKAVITAVVNE